METSTPTRSVIVSGKKVFTENKWREAILFFLNGLWGAVEAITGNPTIRFGNIVLHLIKHEVHILDTPRYAEYYYAAYLAQTEDPTVLSEEIPRFPQQACLVVGRKALWIHDGLMQFMRNPKIRSLTISIQGRHSGLVLWKTENRGEYRMASFGLRLETNFNPHREANRGGGWDGGGTSRRSFFGR